MRRFIRVIVLLSVVMPCPFCYAQAEIKTEYYVDGKIKLEIAYNKRHEKHGIEKLYYETGELWSKTIYVRDRKDGVEQIYYKNGRVMREKPYQKGILQGIERAYWESGMPMEEIPHENGLKNGVAKIYDPGGALIEEQVWKDDELVETRKVNEAAIYGTE